jgi:hypothetical protein
MEASENKTKSSTEENIKKEDKQKLRPEEVKQGKTLQKEEEGENPFGGMSSRDFKKNLGCGG